MTILIPVEKRCAVCGKVDQYLEPISETIFIADEGLDTRPYGWNRKPQFKLYPETCSECGYAAYDISELLPGARAVVQSTQFKECLASRSLPSLAKTYLCHAMILENAGNHKEAGWAYLHAAWACDDENLKKKAHDCRKKALLEFAMARAARRRIAPNRAGLADAIFVDIYRRIGDFESAKTLAQNALKRKRLDKTVRTILLYQLILIKREDSSPHTVSEAHDELSGSAKQDQ